MLRLAQKKRLEEMTKAMLAGNSIYHPSKYWQYLNKKNIAQLNKFGLENIKIQQAFNYFTWYVFNRHHDQFRYVWKHSSIIQIFLAIIAAVQSKPFPHFSMTVKQRWQFVVYMYLLWEYVKRYDKYHLLKIKEPLIGNPLLVKYHKQYISQDLANSILETYSIEEALGNKAKKNLTIMELGAGYGRNIYILLHRFPKAKVIIVDIPPALFISEWYLSKVFPDKKIFPFKNFNSYKDIQEEFEKADIRFLLPHQMEMLQNKSVDLCITISSIHEMQPPQIKAYFTQINRLVKGIFYFKQWKQSNNPYDKLTITETEYPTNVAWKKIYHRTAKIQAQFFEAAYTI